MTSGEWLFAAAGGAVALAGLGLLGWALLGDRVRTRRARRRGDLRRCPRCWYDMSATEGLVCPECGRDARRERRLGRSHRRWRWAAVGLAVVAVGAGTIAFPHGRGGVWRRWLPDTVVIALIPYTSDDHWAVEEVNRRLGITAISAAPRVCTPGRFADWQWRLLRWSCEAGLRRADDPKDGRAFWRLLAMSGPLSETALQWSLDGAASDDLRSREWADMSLERARHGLDDAQLARASETILAAPIEEEFQEARRLGAARMLGVQLESRKLATLAQRDARWAVAAMTPDALVAAIDGQGGNELMALYRRFRFPPGMLVDVDESLGDALEVRRIDIHIDEDDLEDCVLLIWNRHWEMRGSNVHYEGLVLLQRPGGWRLLCRMDLSNCLEGPPQFRSVEADDGRRWMVVEHDAGSTADGSYFVFQDAWYRVRAGRLAVEQAVLHRGYNERGIHQTLESAEPRIVRRGGRYLAAYDITNTLSLTVPSPRIAAEGEPRRLLPIAKRNGTFEYPLGVSDTKVGQHVAPGPWEGKDCTWAFLGGGEVPIAYRDELLALAASGEPGVLAALRAVLDEYIAQVGPVEELVEIRERLGGP